MKKKKLELHWQIVIGLLLGVIWALSSSHFGWSEFTMNWIDPFGKIFINLLKLIAVPLVLFSIIGGVAGIGDPDKLGKMGFKTLGLYLSTTVLAITLGLGLVNFIKPGKLVKEESRVENRIVYELWAKSSGVGIVDDNCFTCDAKNKQLVSEVAKRNGSEIVTAEIENKMKLAQSTKEAGPLQFLVDMVPSNIFVSLNDNGLMLQIIFFALFFGISLLMIPKKSSFHVIELINGINDVFIKMVELIMKAAPYFVFALMAGIVSKMAGDNPAKVLEIFKGLSWYFVVVALGLILMAFGVYPLLLKMFTRKDFSYRKFFSGISEAQALAFSTSSSAATLPVTMECVEENLGVDKRVTSFVLPIGATVNMDGTSLYQAIAVIFLAHLHNVDLDIAHQITIVLTATLASIGSAAIPGAGLVMLMIVLQTVGLDPAWIAIILPVDRLLDMLRTVVNVTGDAAVSTIIAKTEKLD
ncbi:MAG: dicarboxylate/amino acid:cation symporter [Flavobacteriales bacterium]|nr:dicarboxylate/amino acid:cation symporter [Flavobacteriales bacterium]